MGITAVPITEAIGRRPCVVSGVQGDRLSATIPENQFKTEIDMARSTAREHQFGGGATDGVTMNADRTEARRNQAAHLEISKANHRDGLFRSAVYSQ
jgi:hypothetical protein